MAVRISLSQQEPLMLGARDKINYLLVFLNKQQPQNPTKELYSIKVDCKLWNKSYLRRGL